VRFLDHFGGVLGVDHPEQVLCFPVGCVLEEYWTATTTAAAMAMTLPSPRTGSAAAPTASRTISASLGAKKEANGDKQGEGGEQRERCDFVRFLIACLPATQKFRPAWNTQTERFHTPLPWETMTAPSFAACELKGACALTSWLASA
jgi:hypothetical protein